MLQFIKKYQTGGLIDVSAMRNGMRNDERYYKEGAYTVEGRRHLAAIADIEANQNKGLTYVVDDNSQSFKIVNQEGKEITEGTGRGVGQSEFVGPFYGTLGNKRISKRSVSEVMSNANQFRIQPATELTSKDEPTETGEAENSAPEMMIEEPQTPVATTTEGTPPKKGEEPKGPASEFDYANQFASMMMPQGQHTGLTAPSRPDMMGAGGNASGMGPVPGNTDAGQLGVSNAKPVILPDTWKDYGTLVEKNVNGLISALHNVSVGQAGGYKSMVNGGDAAMQQRINELDEAIRLKKQGKPVTTNIKIGVPKNGGTAIIEKSASSATLEELQKAKQEVSTAKYKTYTSQLNGSAESAVNYLENEIKRFNTMKWDNVKERDAVLGYLEYTKDQLVSRYNTALGSVNANSFTNFYGGVDKLPAYNSGAMYWSTKQNKIVDFNTWTKEQLEIKKSKENFSTMEEIKAKEEAKRKAESEAKEWENSFHPVSEHFKEGGKVMKHLIQKAQTGVVNWQQVLDGIAANAQKELIPVEGVGSGVDLIWNTGNMPTLPENYGTSIKPASTLTPKVDINLSGSSTGNYVDYRGKTPEVQAKDAEIGAKDAASATNTIANENKPYGPENDPNYVPTEGDQKVLSDDLYRQEGGAAEPRYKRGPLLSTTGVNIGNMQVQYGDLANLFFAWKAKNQKLAEIPILQEKFTPAGSRLVRAAEDMDAGMWNEAQNQISGIRKQYRGSDPIMDMISGHMARGQRNNAEQELISKRAAIRMSERERVANELEQKRQQESADNLRQTDVDNRNTERRVQGEAMKAQQEVARQSAWWANVNSIIQNAQSRNNQQHAVDQQFETGLRVQEHETKVNNIQAEKAALRSQLGTLSVKRYDARTQEELDQIDADIDAINEQLAAKNQELTALGSATKEQARAEAQEIGRGKSLFGFYANGGKLISR